MCLAEDLGSLAFQLSSGNLKSINITVCGNLSELDVSPLEIAVLKGVFESVDEGVNYVNAPIISKKRGINVITSKSKQDCSYLGTITVNLTTDKEVQSVTGALIAKNMPRIVDINEHKMSIEPDEHILVVPHVNKPGMIAQVASVIGHDNVNISKMHVADNTGNGKLSIMLIIIDSPVNAETLNMISKIDGISNAKYIHLYA